MKITKKKIQSLNQESLNLSFSRCENNPIYKIEMKKKKLRQKTGQATLEYLLLIVVVIAIALGIGGPLGRHLTNISGAMLGPDDSYYACLMERAVLPGSAVDCDAAYESLGISISGGIVPGGPGSGNPGSGNPGSGNPGSGNPGSDGSDSDGSDSDGSDSDGSDSDGSDSDGSDSDGSDSDGSDSDGSDSDGSDSDDSASDDGKNGTRSRSSLPSRHKVGGNNSGLGSLAETSDSSLARENTQSRFSALNEINGEDEGESDDETGTGGKRKRKSGKNNSGATFGEQEGYKANKFPARTGSSGQGYLGELYRNDEEREAKRQKFFRAEAISQKAGGIGFSGDERKSNLNQATLSNHEYKPELKSKGIKFFALIKYLVIAAVIIFILMFIFSQVMEYQSQD